MAGEGKPPSAAKLEGVLATTVIAVLAGVCLCAAVVGTIARRWGLPVRETLMWFGLAELDAPALARAREHRRSR